MSIDRTKTGLWRKNVRIRINGKIVERVVTAQTKEALKLAVEQKKQELRQNAPEGSLTVPKIELHTFADLLTLYKAKKGPFSESHTKKIDSLSKEIGHIAFDLFPEWFEHYYQALKVQKSPKTNKPLSNRAINRKTEIVKASYNLLVELEIISKNPINNIRVKKLKEIPRDVVLSDEQQEDLLKAIRKSYPYIEALVKFALQVPCRRSELINMRKDDLDLFNNAIRVKNGTTKNDCGVWKPIPPNMVEYFRNIPKESEFLFYRVVNGSRIDRSGENKKYLPLGDFKKAWRGALKEAGLSNIGLHLHDTRHIAATNLVDNGTPEEVVMTVANWKTNMLRVYYNRNPKKALSLVQFKRATKDCADETAKQETVKAM